MESNPNNSRIGLQFGTLAEGTEKASVRVSLNFGKAAANAQTEKLKTLIGAEESNLTVVLVLTPAPGMHSGLETLLRGLLEGKEEGSFARDMSSPFSQGLASYNILQSGSKLILTIRPGDATSEMVNGMVGMALGMGVDAMASTEQACVNLSLLSSIDFNELLTLHEQSYTSLAAFCKGFLAEVTLKSAPGSQLDKKILDIMKMMIPEFSSTPMPLLELTQQVDVDFAFRSTDELPPNIRSQFNDDRDARFFPRVPKDLKESSECKLFERFMSVLTSQVEVYATLENVAAIHVDINTPGFGVALTTPMDETLHPLKY